MKERLIPRDEQRPKGPEPVPAPAVMSPRDGQRIDDCEDFLAFIGYAFEPTSEVILNVWHPAQEEWKFLNWAVPESEDGPFTHLYPWRTDGELPFYYWSSRVPGDSCPDELEVRLRFREKREDGSHYEVRTFDDSGFECFWRALSTADWATDAIVECATGSELTLIAPRAGCGTSHWRRDDCELPIPMPWCQCEEDSPSDPQDPPDDPQDPPDDPQDPPDEEDPCVPDEECEVHPRECDGRGGDWMVEGRTVCEDGEAVCVARRGRDYCTSCGGVCGECGGGTCSDDNLCAPGMVCAQHDMPLSDRFFCRSLSHDECPRITNFCWTPEEIGNETLACSR